MASLEIIKFRDVVEVNSLPRFVPGLGALTLEVIGEDFSSVEEVFINDMLISNIIIVDKTRMWVELPRTIQRISSIEVISSKFTKTLRASKIQFKIGTKTKEISGILKLLQLFTKWILQTPGSAIFYPTRGGGLQELVGKVTTSRKVDSILATISRSVDATASQIRTVQTRRADIPLSEKLLSAALIDLKVHSAHMIAVARIRLRSMAGETAVSTLEL